MPNHNRTKPALMFLLISLGCIPVAHATHKVYSPHVEVGELELETRGHTDFDDRNSKDGKWKQKFAVGYGVTDRWFTEVYGEVEREPGKDADFEAIEWENRFQLTEQGEFWVDLGLYAAIEFPTDGNKAEKVEGKLLLEKDWERFVHTLNLTLKQEIGGDAAADLEGGIQWRSKYLIHPWFEPGVEYYADFGVLHHGDSFDDEAHQLGPVIAGKIKGLPIKYEIGYLFGISDAAPDGTLKWLFEYELHF